MPYKDCVRTRGIIIMEAIDESIDEWDRTARDAAQFLPPADRERFIRETLEVPSGPADEGSVSTRIERRVWFVSTLIQPQPRGPPKTFDMLREFYLPEEYRLPTIEYFTEHPPSVGETRLDVRIEHHLYEQSASLYTLMQPDTHREKFAAVRRVLKALTRAFVAGAADEAHLQAGSVLSILRKITITLRIPEELGVAAVRKAAGLLSELEIAFQAFVVRWEDDAEHVDLFPKALSYELISIGKEKTLWGSVTDRRGTVVAHEMVTGGLDPQPQPAAPAILPVLTATQYVALPENRHPQVDQREPVRMAMEPYDWSIAMPSNYARRSSTTPALFMHAPNLFSNTREAEQYRAAVMRDHFELPADAADDTISTQAEREVWYIYGMALPRDMFFRALYKEDYYGADKRFPTFSYFAKHPPAYRGDTHLYLKIEYDGRDETEAATDTKYAILKYVLGNLARRYREAANIPRYTAVPPLVRLLRSVLIDIRLPEHADSTLLEEVARVLRDLEWAYLSYVSRFTKDTKADPAHVQKYPQSLGYEVHAAQDVLSPEAETVERYGVYIANHMRMGGSATTGPTWPSHAWNVLNATRYVRRVGVMAAFVQQEKVAQRPLMMGRVPVVKPEELFNYAWFTSPDSKVMYRAGDLLAYLSDAREAEIDEQIRAYLVVAGPENSTRTEREVWWVADLAPAGMLEVDSRIDASFYYDEAYTLYPIEYFIRNPVHDAIGMMGLRVNYTEYETKQETQEAQASIRHAERMRTQFAVLHRVLVALTTLFRDARSQRVWTDPGSLIRVLRYVHISVDLWEAPAQGTAMKTARMLSDLEQAFAEFAERGMPATRLQNEPISLRYVVQYYHTAVTEEGGIVVKHADMVRNELRLGGESEKPTWQEEGWSVYNATAFVRRAEQQAAHVVTRRRVFGAFGYARAPEDGGDASVVMAQSLF